MLMSPEQSPAPIPIQPDQSPYDFLLNPAPAAKPSKIAGKLPLPHDPFLRRIVIILGGGIGLVIVVAILASIIFGGTSASANLTTLAQQQNELIRIATAASNQAVSQTTKNLAINTQLVLTTDQEQLLAYAKKHGLSIGTKELAGTKSTDTDTQLSNALAASNYDVVFIQIVQSQLTTYQALVKQTFTAIHDNLGRQLLNNDYTAASALLAQATTTSQ